MYSVIQSKKLAILTLAIFVTVALLGFAQFGSAHQDPEACNASGLQQFPSIVSPAGSAYDGSTITYSVIYINSDPDGAGPVAPCNITGADATIDLPGAGGVINVLTDATLNIGESISCPGGAGCVAGPYTYVVAHGDEVNNNVRAVFDVVGVLHQSTNEGVASDRDTLGKGIIHPSTITSINSSAISVLVGGTIDLTITEQHNGTNGNLSNANVVVDNGIGTLNSASANFSGDDGDNILEAGEIWQWLVNNVVINGDTTFTAIGHGTDSNGNDTTWCADTQNPEANVLCDQDERDSVTVEAVIPTDPSIDIEKSTNGQDADTPTGPIIVVGGAVNWTYVVTNTGDVTLTNIVVTDDKGVVVTCPKTTLAPAESMNCTANGVATAGQYANIGSVVGTPPQGDNVSDTDPSHYFGEVPASGATLLIIDEDSLDNGIHFNALGGLITPNGPNFFTVNEVNDDKPGKKQRDVLRYFLNNVGETITVKTGQTGDEGWFAPNCIPRKWLGSGNSNECLTGAERANAIGKFFLGPVPSESRLDKIPHVIPLRALGLHSLVGKDVCAVVYDSDISVNYDHGKSLGVNANLQGETLGIAAFHVDLDTTLNGFSGSTLPQMTITILNTSICGNWTLFNAPVPQSSSVPNDRVAPGSPNGYRSLKVWPSLGLFY